MDISTLRQKVQEYILIADDEKVEAIYTLIKDDVAEQYEWWNDEEMVAELEQISADMDSGKDPGVRWQEFKAEMLNHPKESNEL